jgi:integrase
MEVPHVVIAAGCRWSSPFAGDDVRISRGSPTTQQGPALPGRPADHREIVAVMRHAGNSARGHRLRGLIVVLWRAGLRIHEALLLNEGDLDRRRGSLLVRRGKGGRRREGVEANTYVAYVSS